MLLLAQKKGRFLYAVIDSSYNIEKYAYKNRNGEIVVPFAKYSMLYTDTISTIGFVRKPNSGIWAIDTEGKELFKIFSVDNGPDYLHQGLFRIVNNKEKIGYANSIGNIVIKPEYDGAFVFAEGLAAVCFGCKNIKIDQYLEE